MQNWHNRVGRPAGSLWRAAMERQMRFESSDPFVDLCGDWQVAVSASIPEEASRSAAALRSAGCELLPARVPGNVELDLLANGRIPEPFQGMNIAKLRWLEDSDVCYCRTFDAQCPQGREPWLVFEGVDCDAEIALNGRLIGRTDNMLVPHAFAVPDGLLRERGNELGVRINPAARQARMQSYYPHLSALGSNYDSLFVRKAPHMYGWDIMPRAVSAGLWRPVRLEFRAPEHLEHVYLRTRAVREGEASLEFFFNAHCAAAPGNGYSIRVEGRCGQSVFTEERPMLFQSGSFGFGVGSPLLWWPRGRGSQNLYRVTVWLLKDGKELHRLSFRHGIRTVELDRTEVTDEAGSGKFVFLVNGEKIFAKGSNWVPADAYHSRDAERIPRMLDLAEEAGCNMLRCWGGNVYENDLFYDICDEKGIMVWQDFAMACGIYPQDPSFQTRMEQEARSVVRRLRQHACVVLWAGDNECDMSWLYARERRDPNDNVLTRKVIPQVLGEEDASRPYLPSSPYVGPEAFRHPESPLAEDHLWGPRDYFKGNFYVKSVCHFASEIGYHGCPSPESLARFISPERLWPYSGNPEWLLHCTSPVPGVDLYDYRVELMAKQVRALFGEAPDNLRDYAFASQCCQAEAKKFFIELFRGHKWRRTGILWWNLVDGWPQLSDAVVDYYFTKKLAFHFIRTAQQPLVILLREPRDGRQEVVACNDTRGDLTVAYTIRDADSGKTVAEGGVAAHADSADVVGEIPYVESAQRFYVIRWESSQGSGVSHYLAGRPPFSLSQYRKWLEGAGLLPEDIRRWCMAER